MSNPVEWSPEAVASQLRQIGLGKYGSKFISNGISGEKLYSLKDVQMRDLGLPVASRVTLTNWIKSLPPPQKKSTSRASKPSRPALGRSTIPSHDPEPEPHKSRQTSTRSRPTATLAHSKPETVTVKPRTSSRAPTSAVKSTITKTRFATHSEVKPVTAKVTTGIARKSAKRAAMPMEIPDDGPDDRVPCSYCGRRFAPDRIKKHEDGCAAMSKKRRVFNSKKQRLQGTEATQFQRAASKVPAAKPKTINGKKKYVVEHENLVKALRAARKFAAYEEAASKGKAKGPPPSMPVMEDLPDDRIRCKYCGRRFGQEQYERHAPICAKRAPIPSVKKTTRTAKPAAGTGRARRF